MRRSLFYIFVVMVFVGCTSSVTRTDDWDPDLRPHYYNSDWDTVFNAVKDTFNDIGWPITATDKTAGVVEAKTGLNLFSLEDHISIQMAKTDKRGIRLTAYSGSVLNTAIIHDLWKNRRNIKRIFRTLDKKLEVH